MGTAKVAGDAVQLLWTSGWDSTFRLLSALVLEDATVQPHYIADRQRRSTDAELRAMEKIRSALARSRPGSERRVLPLIVAELAEIPPDEQTRARFERLAARGPIGSQYEWIARYAHAASLSDLELSIHRDDRARAHLEGHVEKLDEPFPGRRVSPSYRLSDAARGTDLALFERFTFPVYDLTKLDMRALAQQHGFLEILELSWFCHRPLGDVPCGLCNPCLDAVKEGMAYRLPRISRLRQAVHRVVPWTKVTGRLRGRGGGARQA